MTSTMSYCAFENAKGILADAICKLNGMIEDETPLSSITNDHERASAKLLYQMCGEFIDKYEELEEMED